MGTVTLNAPLTRERFRPLGHSSGRSDRAVADGPAVTPVILTITLSVPDGQLPPTALRMVDALQSLAERHCAVVRIEPTASPGETHHVRPAGGAEMALRVASRQLFVNGLAVGLTRREYDLLAFLCAHPRQVFNRAQLLRLVWGYPMVGGERTVDVHVRRLRVKLGDLGPTIVTMRGIGYRLDHIERITIEAGTSTNEV